MENYIYGYFIYHTSLYKIKISKGGNYENRHY